MAAQPERTSRRWFGSLDEPSLFLALGPILVVLVAGGLVPFRERLGPTNIALLVAIIVMIAAMSDRTAGVVTAVVAAIAYNFFHTVPYRSLRINEGRDILTVVLLVVIGLVVGEISARRRGAVRSSKRHVEAEHSLEVTSEMLARGASVDEVWEEVRRDLIRVMRVQDCRFEEVSLTPLPLIARSGAFTTKSRTWSQEGFELPPEGAAIPVVHAGVALGQIVLVPSQHSGSVRDERRVAVALADQLAVAVSQSATDRH